MTAQRPELPAPALAKALDLTASGPSTFEGHAPATSLIRVHGGQLIAQTLRAAGLTVPADRAVHSLHTCFLRSARQEQALEFAVHRHRDSSAFSRRLVTVSQEGREVLTMQVSFHAPEEGLDYEAPAPDLAPPELVGDEQVSAALRARFDQVWPQWEIKRREVAKPDGTTDTQYWVRLREALPDDPLLHACALAYASDMSLLSTLRVPHGFPQLGGDLSSLDHTVWFHRPIRADEWMLFNQEPHWTGRARGFATGRVFTRDGRLAASIAQEGLFRLRH